jgi:hypothetical protein
MEILKPMELKPEEDFNDLFSSSSSEDEARQPRRPSENTSTSTAQSTTPASKGGPRATFEQYKEKHMMDQR